MLFVTVFPNCFTTPKYTQQKYYKLIMKPLYTEVFTLKISSTQKRTLEKLKSRNIKVSDFVRKAISEKIKRVENLVNYGWVKLKKN